MYPCRTFICWTSNILLSEGIYYYYLCFFMLINRRVSIWASLSMLYSISLLLENLQG
uniref:Uncharacterized protein n=1 Tax=Rhizophora mucronata TaxID=61149 RepID=A0A2P2P5Z0_RHIMU